MYQTIKVRSVGFNLRLCPRTLARSTAASAVLVCMVGFVLSWGQRYWREERERKINLIKALPFLIGLMGNCGMKLKRQHRVNYCDELP